MKGLKRADSTTDLAKLLDDGTHFEPSPPDEIHLSYKQNIIKLLTGKAPGDNYSASTGRLKLLLLASFVGLHVLNLCTTLSTKTAILRHSSTALQQAASHSSIDLASPSVSAILDLLSSLHPSNISLVAVISAPLHVHMNVPGLSSNVPVTPSRPSFDVFASTTPLASLDRFMTAWSSLVGDPVMSKWIVIALGISVFLNGYLLKGVAIGSSRAEAAVSAARILLASTGQLDLDEEKPGKFLRRHSETSELNLPHRSSQNYKQKMSTRADGPLSTLGDSRRRTISESTDDAEKESVPSSPLQMLGHPRPRRLQSSDPSLINKEEDLPTARPALILSTPTMCETENSSVASDLGSSTPATTMDDMSEEGPSAPRKPRPLEECLQIFKDGAGALLLFDEEIILLVQKGKVAAYSLEKLLRDHQRAVRIRRALICKHNKTAFRAHD